MSPFLPVNKILLNEENDYNTETIDTSRSEKDDMSHTSRYDSIAKAKDTKNCNDDDEYKEDTSKYQDGNKHVDNPETSDTLRGDSVIKIAKEQKALIKRLMTMNFKHNVIQSGIDIVTLCGGKWYNWRKKPAKYKWEIPAVIPLIPIVGVNHCLPILHLSKRMVHIYTTGKTIHKFAIGYMIKPSLQFKYIYIKNKLKNASVIIFILG